MSVPLELTPLAQELKRLRLPTIRQQYPELELQAQTEGWSHREYLERLVQAEVTHRREVRPGPRARRASPS